MKFTRHNDRRDMSDESLDRFTTAHPDDPKQSFTISADCRADANEEYARRAHQLAFDKGISYEAAAAALAKQPAGRALLRMAFARMALTHEAEVS